MKSPAALEVIEFLRQGLRVEVATKKEGGGDNYMDSPLSVETTVKLYLDDELISEDTSTIYP